jgi:hypothetical protein
VRFDLTEDEFAELEKAAGRAGLAKGAYAAEAAMAAARGGVTAPGEPFREAGWPTPFRMREPGGLLILGKRPGAGLHRRVVLSGCRSRTVIAVFKSSCRPQLLI